jgi:hypothetical protein
MESPVPLRDAPGLQSIILHPVSRGASRLNWAELVSDTRHTLPVRLGSYLISLTAQVLGLAVWLCYGAGYQGRGILSGVWKPMGDLVARCSLYLAEYARRVRAPSAREVAERDERRPILLLRAFLDDYVAVDDSDAEKPFTPFGPTTKVTFEEMLAELFSRCGPVIALGRPGERVPPLGAARLWVSDERWQQGVNELLSDAQLVIMVMGNLENRNGLRWEAEQVLQMMSKYPRKVLLVVPPVEEGEVYDRWEQYRQLSRGQMPIYEGGEIAARFAIDGSAEVARIPETGVLVKGYTRDAAAYRTAIRVRS